jgi:hypothetical protein
MENEADERLGLCDWRDSNLLAKRRMENEAAAQQFSILHSPTCYSKIIPCN